MKVIGRLLIASLFVNLSIGSAHADMSVTGRINSVLATDITNMGFRITLAGLPAMCESGQNFAYVLGSHNNYQVFVATLQLAFASGKQVTISSVQNSSSWCEIFQVVVTDP